MRRWVQPFFLFASLLLAFVGVALFAGGLLAELLSSRSQSPEGLSPAIQWALTGLCLAIVMMTVWFVVVGWMLARQSRALGSGYGDAYRLIEAFRFREAIPLLERSIREGKETAEVLMLLTSAYAYTGQLGKAQATADRAVRLFPDDAAAYTTLANGYRMQAMYDEAARALLQATELDPDQPVIWAELGFAYHFAGNREKAVEAFKRAAQQPMPAMYGVRVYYHLAQAYQTSGEAEQAARSAARMMSARDGLTAWKSNLNALEGTAYGQALRYEIAAVEQALVEADAANLG
ncbi:MAG: tetratricopeptide repeat protein [Chloroflexi bacterium]|nr:tetratricopeptide repeat protein [Chloroflexota bacterium]